MLSPLTGKPMVKQTRDEVLQYRKDEFKVIHHFWLDTDSEEEFTDAELDEININQVYNQYRVKYGIPFPEEIIKIREQYGLSAVKMSELLGFGPNTYRQYEAGEVPSAANGKLIKMAGDPAKMIDLLGSNSESLTKEDFLAIKRKIENQETESQRFIKKQIDSGIVFLNNDCSSKTGYRQLDIERIKNVLRYLHNSGVEITKVKVNKLFFFLDFLVYGQTTRSLTGMSYRAIQMGPVPAEYDRIYTWMSVAENWDVEEKTKDNQNYYDVIIPVGKFNPSRFSPKELNLIEKVVARFGTKNSNELVELSHQENAWKDNKEKKEIIDYERYGFCLAGEELLKNN